MKKQISLIVVFMITLSIITIPKQAFAGLLSANKRGIVTDVIDGEALAIQFGDANVLIKLIGVNTNASEKALEYVNNTVVGKYVWVVTEELYNVAYTTSNYHLSYVYMYDTGEMLNAMILQEGLGELNTTHHLAARYEALVTAQSYGKSKKLGIWQSSNSNSSNSGEGTNINTATSTELKAISPKITSSIASNIMSYRKYNAFNKVSEIKFVPGMTKLIYDSIYSDITVVTNINEASEEELLTLADLSQDDVDSILEYRDDHQFTNLTQFYTKTEVSSTKYNANKNFISLDYEENIDYSVGDRVVNINTASSSQISSAGSSAISSSIADKIVSYRRNGYTYKTLMELCEISGISISDTIIDKVEDNFKLYTDINNATTSELQSLFGSSYVSSEISEIEDERPFSNISELEDIIGSTKYNKIKEFIYEDDYQAPIRTNINLATVSQLGKLSVSSSEVTKLTDKYKELEDASDLPFDLEDIDTKISLYTNINMATEEELQSIYSMKAPLLSAIVTYRDEQPFGSMDEVEDFFIYENEKSFYNYIKEFIVVR